MCRWSGQLGPKRKEGDRQAPEGYYAITPAQLNPKSNYHLSYDMGYPNAYDRAHGGTGSYLMVHGDCSSAGCYSMTDKQIEEIYALVREAQSGGQKAVQMEAFPFRFTAANLARHRSDPNMPFWRNLKEGADRFEITKARARGRRLQWPLHLRPRGEVPARRQAAATKPIPSLPPRSPRSSATTMPRSPSS